MTYRSRGQGQTPRCQGASHTRTFLSQLRNLMTSLCVKSQLSLRLTTALPLCQSASARYLSGPLMQSSTWYLQEVGKGCKRHKRASRPLVSV